MPDRMVINEELYLAQITRKDIPELLEMFNDVSIVKWLGSLPLPYTEADAHAWIDLVEKGRKAHGLHNWSVFNKKDRAIGGIGQKLLTGTQGWRDEMGYYLHPAYWGKGIMTQIIAAYRDHVFCTYPGFIRLEATPFSDNPASLRVLEKTGFVKEGLMRNYLMKKGQAYDVYMYAMTRKEWEALVGLA